MACRLMIVAEGQTEADFINQVLAPHLQGFGVMVANPINMRGHITVQGLTLRVKQVLSNYDAVSTLVDFYGFKREKQFDPWSSAKELEALIAAESCNPQHFIPYAQLHEFEALLFSCPHTLVKHFHKPTALPELQHLINSVDNPEQINNSYETKPSKRLEYFFAGYAKGLHGVPVAVGIGLGSIREKCPRFNAWITRLEQLGNLR